MRTRLHVDVEASAKHALQAYRVLIDTLGNLPAPPFSEMLSLDASLEQTRALLKWRQSKVAEALGIASHRVVVECPRMGGGFGGKESQAAHVAQLAALGAHHTGRPVRLRLHRGDDMVQTGHRHPWLSRFEAGFNDEGKLLALTGLEHADPDGIRRWRCTARETNDEKPGERQAARTASQFHDHPPRTTPMG